MNETSPQCTNDDAWSKVKDAWPAETVACKNVALRKSNVLFKCCLKSLLNSHYSGCHCDIDQIAHTLFDTNDQPMQPEMLAQVLLLMHSCS